MPVTNPGITSVANAQATALRKPAEQLIQAVARYIARVGGKEVAKEIAELGGEATMRRIAERALREGGEDALSTLARHVRAYGPDALRAVDNAVNMPRLLSCLDEIPKDMAPQAIRRLAAGTEGRALAKTVERFGSQVLRAEVRHPGLGGHLVGQLGEDGFTLALRASRDQAIMIARHADDIAKLPKSQRQGILRLLRDDLGRMIAFIGRFMEKNPGKVLFTASATTVILAHPDKVLGAHEDIIEGPEGTPVLVQKPGMIDRMLNPLIRQVMRIALPIFAVAVAFWLAIKLRFYYRLTKLKHNLESQQLQQKVAKRAETNHSS
jgi:hypothetical protein